MNFLRFSFKPLLIFLTIIPLWGFAQYDYKLQIPTAEPVSNVVTSLPTSQAYNFKNITTIGNNKLVVTGINNLWVFDGQNWENVSLQGNPIQTTCSKGNFYIAHGRQIEKLELIENNLINRIIVVDSLILANKGSITSIHVANENIFFTTPNGLWVYSDKLTRLDSVKASNLIFGNADYALFFKSTDEVFSLNPIDLSLKPIEKNLGINVQDIVGVSTINNSPIVITRKNPWFLTVGSKAPALPKSTSYLKSLNATVIKAYEDQGKVYLLTDTDGIVVISKDDAILSHNKTGTSHNLEHAIDISPLSENEILVLTHTSILNIFNTEIAGIYSSEQGLKGIPNGIFTINDFLYCATKEGLFVSQYTQQKSNSLSFSVIPLIKEPISKLVGFNNLVYAIGNDGVYSLNGYLAKTIFRQASKNNKDLTTVSFYNNELWLFWVSDNTISGYCLSNSSLEKKIIPYTQNGQVIEKLKAHGNIIFFQSIDGLWHYANLSEDKPVWESLNIPNIPDGSLYYESVSFDDPLLAVKGDLYHFNFQENTIGEKLVNDSLALITPLYKNKSRLIAKRFLKEFPNVTSIWLYDYNTNSSIYEPILPIAGLQSTELINQVLCISDSTLFIATSSGLRYFSIWHSAIQKPIATIFKASLESDNRKEFLINGNFNTKPSELKPAKIFRKRSLKVTFASKDSDQWVPGYGNTQFSSFLVGYDSDWTPWTNNNMREINRLSKGVYTFMVKSKNALGVESEVTSLNFTIKPHFFETNFFILGMIVMGIIGMFALFNWRRYNHSKLRFKLESLINQRTEELVKEKEKTDNLLARVLPKDTASELKEKGRVNTQRFQVVTVLFCDIEGFTRITEETNPELLIDQLDRFFLYFDSVVEKYRIEKIKTIGDAYMCAGGIPKKNRTNPVEVVLAALEMMHYMRDITTQSGVHQKVWELRIGVDTGPVIAGVVGRNKLSYDIWGSTVNTASRMESSGEAGQINISGNTNMLVKDYFICEFRGKMPVKNKGDIQMYFVKGIKPNLSEGLQGIAPNHEFRILIQLVRLGDLEDFLLEKLEKGLPKNLYYHNLKHTVDVYTQVELIGRSEEVSKEELLVLRTAALFHDAGHLIDYDTHEEMAVKLVREILPEYLYTERQIEVISELIMCTKLPPNPKNLLEEIMCDADLDYLGRPDFIPVSNNLYKELHEHGKVGTLRDWNELQIRFIDKHSYFTKTARRLRNVNKQSQLDKIIAWLEKN
jgi:adenylate cyclase